MKKVKTLLELPEDLNKKIKVYGAKNDLNITNSIVKILTEYFKKEA